MPTLSIPIDITTLANTKLTVEVTNSGAYSGLVNRIVNIAVVNGELITPSPYTWIVGGPNPPLEIVNITHGKVFIIFSDPVGLWVNDFDLTNAILYPYTRTIAVPILQKYNAFHNFYDNNGTDLNDDRNYNSAFNTTKLNLLETSQIDLKLQAAYDGSVNMIWTDDANPMRIVNSRFSVDESGTIATLIDRRAKKDANTYNEINFHQTELIPRSIIIPTLTFNGLNPGGILPGGGYRHFFKYINADGAETDIIEESRLVSVHEGATTLTAYGSSTQPTTKAVSFTLSKLDQSFYGIVVYYTISLGEVDSVDKAAKILAPYIIQNDGTCSIIHTGYEAISEVNIETLSLTYSVISRSRTLDVVNSRLLVGNTDATDIYDQDLAIAASSIVIDDSEFFITQSTDLSSSTALDKENNYSNPEFIYNNLGYWKGETYELGAVFITNQGLSPVYPIQGIDNIDNLGVYNPDIVGGLYNGYAALGQNAMGIFRTENRRNLWTVSGNTITFSGTNLSVDITNLGTISQNIKGFFFVRRTRKKDCLMQGLITAVAAIPIESKFGSEYEKSGFGNWCGVGVTANPSGLNPSGGSVKYVPAPGGMMPFGVEEIVGTATIFSPLLDDAGRDVTVVSVDGTHTIVTLTSVGGLSIGDTVKFTGYSTGTILSVNGGASQITMTAALSPVPVATTLGKK